MTWNRTLAALALTVVTVALAAPPASAGSTQSFVKYDRRGDAPSDVDLTRVSGSTDGSSLTFTASVRDLRGTGALTLNVAVAGYVDDYHIRRTSTGLHFSAEEWSEVSHYRTPCSGVRVTWSASRNYVHGRIPFSTCGGSVSPGDPSGVLFEGARMVRGTHHDVLGHLVESVG